MACVAPRGRGTGPQRHARHPPPGGRAGNHQPHRQHQRDRQTRSGGDGPGHRADGRTGERRDDATGGVLLGQPPGDLEVGARGVVDHQRRPQPSQRPAPDPPGPSGGCRRIEAYCRSIGTGQGVGERRAAATAPRHQPHAAGEQHRQTDQRHDIGCLPTVRQRGTAPALKRVSLLNQRAQERESTRTRSARRLAFAGVVGVEERRAARAPSVRRR